MSWNLWKHIRLIGAVLAILAAFIHRVELSAVGLLFIAVGIVGAVDRLERYLEEKEKGNEKTEA